MRGAELGGGTAEEGAGADASREARSRCAPRWDGAQGRPDTAAPASPSADGGNGEAKHGNPSWRAASLWQFVTEQASIPPPGSVTVKVTRDLSALKSHGHSAGLAAERPRRPVPGDVRLAAAQRAPGGCWPRLRSVADVIQQLRGTAAQQWFLTLPIARGIEGAPREGGQSPSSPRTRPRGPRGQQFVKSAPGVHSALGCRQGSGHERAGGCDLKPNGCGFKLAPNCP